MPHSKWPKHQFILCTLRACHVQALDQGQRCKDGDDTAFFSDGLKISELKHVVFF